VLLRGETRLKPPRQFVAVDLGDPAVRAEADRCLATMIKKTTLGPVTDWQALHCASWAAHDDGGAMVAFASALVGEMNESGEALRPLVSIEWLINTNSTDHHGWHMVNALKAWTKRHDGVLVAQTVNKQPSKSFWPKVLIHDNTYGKYLASLMAAHDPEYRLYMDVSCMYYQ